MNWKHEVIIYWSNDENAFIAEVYELLDGMARNNFWRLRSNMGVSFCGMRLHLRLPLIEDGDLGLSNSTRLVHSFSALAQTVEPGPSLWHLQ